MGQPLDLVELDPHILRLREGHGVRVKITDDHAQELFDVPNLVPQPRPLHASNTTDGVRHSTPEKPR